LREGTSLKSAIKVNETTIKKTGYPDDKTQRKANFSGIPHTKKRPSTKENPDKKGRRWVTKERRFLGSKRTAFCHSHEWLCSKGKTNL